MTLWLVMLAGGLLTYAIRLSFILLWGKIPMPAWLKRGLRFVPPAVFSAIIFPEILISSGGFDLSPTNPRLLAGLLAGVVAWRTGNVLLTILTGMAILLVVQSF